MNTALPTHLTGPQVESRKLSYTCGNLSQQQEETKKSLCLKETRFSLPVSISRSVFKLSVLPDVHQKVFSLVDLIISQY